MQIQNTGLDPESPDNHLALAARKLPDAVLAEAIRFALAPPKRRSPRIEVSEEDMTKVLTALAGAGEEGMPTIALPYVAGTDAKVAKRALKMLIDSGKVCRTDDSPVKGGGVKYRIAAG